MSDLMTHISPELHEIRSADLYRALYTRREIIALSRESSFFVSAVQKSSSPLYHFYLGGSTVRAFIMKISILSKPLGQAFSRGSQS